MHSYPPHPYPVGAYPDVNYSEVSTPMPPRSPRPATNDPWRDAEDTPIALRCRVEQIAVDPTNGALPSRLHQRGQVIGRGAGLLYVIFDRDQQPATLPPHLLRVLSTPGRH